MKAKKAYALAMALGALFYACGGGGGPSDAGQDARDGQNGGDGKATFVKPAGYASVTFWVDDTTNRTYRSGDMEWKGSFVYDPQTNIIVYDASWAGEQGPYPPLYDDGPISQGGHEMPGAQANDHIFSVEVYVKAEKAIDRQFQYGLINEFDNWIWEGPNGRFVVPANSTAQIDAEGYTIPRFGVYDLILELDTWKINEDFRPFDPESQKVYVKGTMNSWDPRQLLDNGLKGDREAGDGIYTYHHSQNLGPHDGLLFAGQHVQFVFMFDALEYKRLDALDDGVSAWTNCAGPDKFDKVPVVLETESRGRIKNTAVVICEGAGEVAVRSVVPAVGDPAGGEQVAVYGGGFEAGARVTFGGQEAGGVEFVGQGQINCKTPAHAPGSVAVRVTNPSGDYGELQNAFSYQSAEQPEILFLEPRRGSTAGGTQVAITGRRFISGASVKFGALNASSVLVNDSTNITCRTPAHAKGMVDVTVTNPGGLSAVFPSGFEYVDSAGPVITGVVPNRGSTRGGETVTVTGSGFLNGASVKFGNLPASEILVNPPGSIQCKTPAHAPGKVAVTVTNPDGQSDTHANAFTYEVPLADWAALISPMSFVVFQAEVSPFIFGQVYEPGVTEAPGCASVLTAQLGYGPVDSDPQNSSHWQWQAAQCNLQCQACGNNDEFMGKLTINNAGQYWYTFRFSLDDGASWKVADGRGVATVRGSTGQLSIWQIAPPFGGVRGGDTIEITGEKFANGARVLLDDVEAVTTFVNEGKLSVVTPAHAAGAVEVKVINPDNAQATLADGFLYVLRGTPDITPGAAGQIEIETSSGNDWHQYHLAARGEAGSNWGANFADKLYVAYDQQNLYLGIEGFVESDAPGNALVVYLDLDYGRGTGTADMNTLTDNWGVDSSLGLDNAISSKVMVLATGFGAEYAAGTLGMAGIEAADNGPQRWNLAGLRRLTPPDNFPWIAGATVRASAVNKVVEMALPWQTLGGFPAGGRVGLFARLVNHDGQYLSNDTLPADDGANPDKVNRVLVLEIR